MPSLCLTECPKLSKEGNDFASQITEANGYYCFPHSWWFKALILKGKNNK